jgi:hypothetical protein
VTRGWNRFWFAPAPARSFVIVRALVAVHALWIVLSRYSWPRLASWPALFFTPQLAAMRLRFGIGLFGESVERVLWLVLIVALLCAMFGSRIAAFVAALLLIHFAPFDDILAGGVFTGAGGLTTAALALVLFGFADAPRRDDPPSWRWRWPVAAVELLVAMIYPLSLLVKLHYAGLGWYAPQNIQLIASRTGAFNHAPWSAFVVDWQAFDIAIGIATLVLEAGFIAVLFSRRARWFFVPLALIAAFVRWRVFGFVFVGWPLLFVFLFSRADIHSPSADDAT